MSGAGGVQVMGGGAVGPPGVMPGGMDMQGVGALGGVGGPGGFAGMGVDALLRQQAEQSRALQAQEAAIMLQKVQSMAHGRVGMPGMSMPQQGPYAGGPMGLHMQQNMMRGPQPGVSMGGVASGRGILPCLDFVQGLVCVGPLDQGFFLACLGDVYFFACLSPIAFPPRPCVELVEQAQEATHTGWLVCLEGGREGRRCILSWCTGGRRGEWLAAVESASGRGHTRALC
jgi:hypothetical protein